MKTSDQRRTAAAPLRVALATETYPPEVNGVAGTIARVTEGLRARGHEVQLIRPRQEGDPITVQGPELLVQGMAVPRYPHLKMGLPCRRRLEAAWKDHRPDVVHIATEGPLGWSALQAASSLQIPVTSDYRTNFQEYSQHYGVGLLRRAIQAYLRHFHNRTDCTMVPTPSLMSTLESAGYDRLRVVSRGVDAERFHPCHRDEVLRASWGATDQTLVVTHVGRLAPEKNLGLLFSAFEAMRSVHRDTRLVLVGDGPSRASLERNHPDVIFAGQRLGADLAAHYASGDVFVFPSLTETFGNVTLEAMASGVPVVAYNYAAAAQLVDSGSNGWLARTGNVSEFVHCACRAAVDPEGLRRMRLNARRTAIGRDWGKIVDQVEETMRQAIAGVDWERHEEHSVAHAG